MKDWYTVPAEYGGRALPFSQRLYIEWLWRRHGQAGLDRYLLRLSIRAVQQADKFTAGMELAAAATRTAICETVYLNLVMREAGFRR